MVKTLVSNAFRSAVSNPSFNQFSVRLVFIVIKSRTCRFDLFISFFFSFFSLSLEDYSFTSCVYILVLIQLSQQGHLALTEELKGGGVVINLRRIPDFKLSGK